MASVPLRKDIEDKYKWHDESVFADEKAWKDEFSSVLAKIPESSGFAGHLGESPEVLLAFLSVKDELDTRVSTLMFYATMRSAVDTSDEVALSLESEAGSLYGRYSSALAFCEPELLSLGEDLIHSWCEKSDKLDEYRHWFADLFRLRAHVRSSEVEEVLGSVAEVFGGIDSINNMLVDSDFTFAPAKDSNGKEWPVVQSTVESYLSSPDRTLRQNAWTNFCDTHVSFAPTLAANLVTVCKKDSFIARVRNYSSSLDAALNAHNIPVSVYETTLETFKKHLPVWHRYWKVKANAMGLKKLSHWDIWAPLSKDSPKVGYEEAVEWISSALSPLGKDYADILKKGCLEDRWVDVFPTQGKSSGAFSYGSRATKPFIMMSWAGDLSSLSTLTHELGHSMHSYHTWKNQSPAYCDYSIFVAEVASNFHQAMTRAWLFEHQKDPEFQIALIEEAMENFHRYFFIMPILALFEREVHERTDGGKGITASDLSSLMTSLFSQGYGDGVEIDAEREGSTWAQFGHLYSNFYVFQYATGISAAHALAAPILAGDTDAVSRYREFLSSGSSLYPVDALKKAGIDMSGPEAMEKGFEVLSGLIDRLEKLIEDR